MERDEVRGGVLGDDTLSCELLDGSGSADSSVFFSSLGRDFLCNTGVDEIMLFSPIECSDEAVVTGVESRLSECFKFSPF